MSIYGKKVNKDLSKLEIEQEKKYLHPWPIKKFPRTVKVHNSPGHPVQLITKAVILLPTT